MPAVLIVETRAFTARIDDLLSNEQTGSSSFTLRCDPTPERSFRLRVGYGRSGGAEGGEESVDVGRADLTPAQKRVLRQIVETEYQ